MEKMNLIKNKIAKKKTNFIKNLITPDEKLMITLRYLATGDSYVSMSYNYKLGVLTIKQIIGDTIKALWDILQPIHMMVPTLEMFEEVAQGFEEMWNFPNCIGPIDVKHCKTNKPPHTGTQFFNYKHGFSIILQALVDFNGKFMVIDVGSYGSQSDGGVFANSLLSKRIENSELPIPRPKLLPISNIVVPHVFLGDGAYPLKRYLKPYIKNNNDDSKIFNYRLSWARRIVECSFGVLTSKWRILLIEDIIKATCILHNIILTKENLNIISFDPVGSNYSLWNQQSIKNSSDQNKNIRNLFSNYFNNIDILPWQTNILNKYLFYQYFKFICIKFLYIFWYIFSFYKNTRTCS
ncbi:putative nuclease HARBI1 [Gordionus sp. m RMFG-2023]|uniref:putative nuclease HARBI1 n=1 Tax=Gordionus sp. m RMFG-2023 TaxID=3053472 RepID=UPI0031FBCCFE